MPTARSRCSAIIYDQWLVVAGGLTSQSDNSLTVEVLNIDSKQWYSGPPTPRPWNSVKAVSIGDEGYFMGDDMTYSVSLPNLISQLNSAASSKEGGQIWKAIPGLHLTYSTPLTICGSLLAVGGFDRRLVGKSVTDIHLYQPNTQKWVKVRDLPSPCHSCTCVMITEREMFVAGGVDGHEKIARANIVQIN